MDRLGATRARRNRPARDARGTRRCRSCPGQKAALPRRRPGAGYGRPRRAAEPATAGTRARRGKRLIDPRHHDDRNLPADGLGDDAQRVGVGDAQRRLVHGIEGGRSDDHRIGPRRPHVGWRAVADLHGVPCHRLERRGVHEGERVWRRDGPDGPLALLRQPDQHTHIGGRRSSADDDAQLSGYLIHLCSSSSRASTIRRLVTRLLGLMRECECELEGSHACNSPGLGSQSSKEERHERLQGDGDHRDEQHLMEDAAAEAIRTASGTLRDLRVAEVVQQDIHLEDGGAITFRTKLQLSFKYEDSH